MVYSNSTVKHVLYGAGSKQVECGWIEKQRRCLAPMVTLTVSVHRVGRHFERLFV